MISSSIQGERGIIEPGPGDAIAGIYDTYLEAAREGWRRFGNVPLLVRQIREIDVVETAARGIVDA